MHVTDASSGDREGTATRTPLSRRVLTPIALVWLIGGVVYAALLIIVPRTVWHVAGLSLLNRIGLACYSQIAALPATALIALCVSPSWPRAGFPRPAARVRETAALAAAFLTLCFQFASWAEFYSTGGFANWESWLLTASNPMLLLAHVMAEEPLLFLIVPLVSLAMLLLYRWTLRKAVEWPAGRARAVVRFAGVALAAVVLTALSADVSTRRSTPPESRNAASEGSVRALFVSSARERSGAWARLLGDLRDGVLRAGTTIDRWTRTTPQGATVLGAGEYAAGANRTQLHHWNVVVVLFESLRADELTALGSRRVVMPALERLAAEGTLYARAYSPAAQSDFATTAVLASQYPLRGASFHPFPRVLKYPRVLPWDVLQPLGWRTAVFSSQNEEWAGMINFLRTDALEHVLHSETYSGPTYLPANDRGFRAWATRFRRAGKIDDRSTIDEAISWLDSIPASSPFVAYVNLQSSHTPYQQPSGVPPKFGSGRVSFPILFDAYPPDSAPAVRDLYDNSLAYADDQFARLRAALERSGRWDSTVVVAMGDHGEAFFEHGFAAHGSELFAEVLHVPLVIRLPGQAAARDTLGALTLDAMPTVLAALRLPPHPAFQGIDLRGAQARTHRPLFGVSQTPLADQIAIRQDGWSLIYTLQDDGIRLYDLTHDPRELCNVSDANPVARDALTETLLTWYASQVNYYTAALIAPPHHYAPPAPTPRRLVAPRIPCR